VIYYAARNGDYHSKSKFLFHFAEDDDWVSSSSVNSLQKSLAAADRDAAYHVYPGTTHWFFESDRQDVFNQSAATLSWKRTLSFLN
jgi:carboxymethylenebutenolidase